MPAHPIDQMREALKPENPTLDDVEPLFRRTMLLKHPWAEVDDIANAVAFLASDEARYYCGQLLHPNGGEIMP